MVEEEEEEEGEMEVAGVRLGFGVTTSWRGRSRECGL